MANLRILASEEMVGHGHGTKADTLNRHANVEHEEDGTHTGDKIIKGWIQFDGTGGMAIADSFNVDSIVDNGVGSYIVVWDTDFANDDYALAAMAGGGSYFVAIDTMTTAQINIRVFSDAGIATDRGLIHIIAIGDQ